MSSKKKKGQGKWMLAFCSKITFFLYLGWKSLPEACKRGVDVETCTKRHGIHQMGEQSNSMTDLQLCVFALLWVALPLAMWGYMAQSKTQKRNIGSGVWNCVCRVGLGSFLHIPILLSYQSDSNRLNQSVGSDFVIGLCFMSSQLAMILH